MTTQRAIRYLSGDVTQDVVQYKGYLVAYMFTRTIGTISLERGETSVQITLTYKSVEHTDRLLEKFFNVPRDVAVFGSLYNTPTKYVGTPTTRKACVMKIANDVIDFTIRLLELDHPIEYASWYREKGRNLESPNKNAYERFITYVACCSIAPSPDVVSFIDYDELYEFTDT
jgi:hypothetical protein